MWKFFSSIFSTSNSRTIDTTFVLFAYITSLLSQSEFLHLYNVLSKIYRKDTKRGYYLKR